MQWMGAVVLPFAATAMGAGGQGELYGAVAKALDVSGQAGIYCWVTRGEGHLRLEGWGRRAARDVGCACPTAGSWPDPLSHMCTCAHVHSQIYMAVLTVRVLLSW